MSKPTVAKGHMPFAGHRTCEHMFRRRYFGQPSDLAEPFVPRSGFVERIARNDKMDAPAPPTMTTFGRDLRRGSAS
jgi:hypothetical protein